MDYCINSAHGLPGDLRLQQASLDPFDLCVRDDGVFVDKAQRVFGRQFGGYGLSQSASGTGNQYFHSLFSPTVVHLQRALAYSFGVVRKVRWAIAYAFLRAGSKQTSPLFDKTDREWRPVLPSLIFATTHIAPSALIDE